MRTVNSLVDLGTKRFIPIAMWAKHVTGLDLKKPLLFEDKPQFMQFSTAQLVGPYLGQWYVIAALY